MSSPPVLIWSLNSFHAGLDVYEKALEGEESGKWYLFFHNKMIANTSFKTIIDADIYADKHFKNVAPHYVYKICKMKQEPKIMKKFKLNFKKS